MPMPTSRKSPPELVARFEPMAARAMKEYVVVPPDWVRRSRAIAEQLPVKKPKQKKG
jgi:hypothetical protein